MKKLAFAICFLCLSACSTGPTRSVNSLTANENVLLEKQVPTEKVQNLSGDEVKSDIDRIAFTFEKAYAGKDILSEASYSKLMTGLESLKNISGAISSDEFCNQLSTLFNQVDDFHLTANIEGRACGRIWPKGSVGANSGSGDQNRTWSYFFKNKTSVLSLRSMSPDASPDWKGFLAKVQDLIGIRKPFIIDLRGNGGGSTTNAYELVRLLYGLDDQKDIPWPAKDVERIQTAAAYALTANYYWLTSQQYENKKQTPPAYLKTAYQEFVKLSKSAPQDSVSAKQIQSFGTNLASPDKMIQFPIYVLIDRGCGSTCELVVEALERLPFVQTVGERTTGVVQFGFVGWLYLAGSHVIAHVPTQGTTYRDHRQVEKTGYAPQHPVPQGEDAMNFTLKNFF